MAAIVLAILVVTENVLDSVTTRIALSQYPEPTLKGEGNPIMRWLMLRSRWLAEAIKHIAIIVLVGVFAYWQDVPSLRFMAIAFGIVVVNNSWIVISRHVTKRKVKSPGKWLQDTFHIPDSLLYVVVLVIIFGSSEVINIIFW